MRGWPVARSGVMVTADQRSISDPQTVDQFEELD